MIKDCKFNAEQSGIRLDAVLLSRFPAVPRSFVREACDSGLVTVNGRPAPKGMKLKGGETVFVVRLDEACDNRPLADASVKVRCVFEDDSLLAFDKISGMPVQPLSRRETGTLMNGVVARWPECATAGDQPMMGGALHRIDSDTSGLVLVARSEAAFSALRSQFSEHKVKKTYLALVEGAVAVGGTLENNLAHMPGLGYCKMVDPSRSRLSHSERDMLAAKSMHAVTNFIPVGSVREGNEERTLLQVTIFTGVTHQIRAQLALAGMHIVNDRLYGAFAVENMRGHCLHALSAEFRHPVSGELCRIATRHPAWALLK